MEEGESDSGGEEGNGAEEDSANEKADTGKAHQSNTTKEPKDIEMEEDEEGSAEANSKGGTPVRESWI